MLGGCAASTLGDADVDHALATNSAPLRQEVAESVTPTSADAGASGINDQEPTRLTRTNSRTARDDTRSLQVSAAAISAVNTPGSAAYRIGPQDVLEISVFKVTELSKSTQVSEAGTISYPLVGDVVAAGRTPREVERELTGRLGDKYLQKPQVSVFVKEYNSQRVTIEGAVKKPGVFPIQGSLSLLQAVAMAQGLENTSDNTVLVFRTQGGKRSAARFDVAEIRTGDAADPELQAGDVVVAGTSALKEGFSNFLKVLPVTSVFALL